MARHCQRLQLGSADTHLESTTDSLPSLLTYKFLAGSDLRFASQLNPTALLLVTLNLTPALPRIGFHRRLHHLI